MVDTAGYAFSYLVAYWLYGVKVVSYVHYPTISMDMLQVVRVSLAYIKCIDIYSAKLLRRSCG